MPDDADWTISANDLNRLVDLFLQFEGASDPLSVACKELEQQFDTLVEKSMQIKLFQTSPLSAFRLFGAASEIIAV